MRLGPWANRLTDLLLPPGCVSCGTWLPGGNRTLLVCPTCRSRLSEPPWPRCPRCHLPLGTGRVPAADCRECRGWHADLAAARYAFVLRPPADRLVHALKYEGWDGLAHEMGRCMARVALPSDTAGIPEVVVPVPTTPGRVRKRGYNQAELLARSFAEARGLRVVNVLERTREGTTQVALHPSQRRANVRGVFAARSVHHRRVRGARVLLIDDVLTTGSTAMAAASALRGVGAARVVLVVFARALPHPPGFGP